MHYFRYGTKHKEVTLYPIVCMHIGAPQSDIEFIKEHLYRFKHDPTGVMIYMGDGGECVTKLSKGEIFTQTMNPTEQLKMCRNLLWPFRDRILFGVEGNHDYRTFKETGLSWTESLLLALQVPYLGVSALWQLSIPRATFDIYTHHGIDSGVNIGTKVNKAKAFENFIMADAIFSAHSHACMEVQPRHIAYLSQGGSTESHERLCWRTTYEYICGCAYDSRSGYAERKGYPPLLPGYLTVKFHVKWQDRPNGKGRGKMDSPIKAQTCTIYRKGT